MPHHSNQLQLQRIILNLFIPVEIIGITWRPHFFTATLVLPPQLLYSVFSPVTHFDSNLISLEVILFLALQLHSPSTIHITQKLTFSCSFIYLKTWTTTIFLVYLVIFILEFSHDVCNYSSMKLLQLKIWSTNEIMHLLVCRESILVESGQIVFLFQQTLQLHQICIV